MSTKGTRRKLSAGDDPVDHDTWPVRLERSARHGRGVFATRDIRKGEIVERAPLVVVPKRDWPHLAETKLRFYVYELGKGRHGVAGGLASFYNHASPANARYDTDAKSETVTVTAVRTIRAGDEVCLNYDGHPDSTAPVELH